MPNVPPYSESPKSVNQLGLTTDLNEAYAQIAAITAWINAQPTSGGGTGTTQLAAPTGFVATPTGAASIGTSWNPVTNATGFEVRYATNSAFSGARVVAVGAGETSAPIAGLTASTLYYTQVRAKGNGSTTSDSGYSSAVQATTQAGSSTTPTTLTVTATNQRYNGIAEPNNGGTRYYVNSVFSILTDAPSLNVKVYGYNQAGYGLDPGEVWVNGTPFTTLPNFDNGTTGYATYSVNNIPGSGSRQIDFYSAAQQNVAGLAAFNSYVSFAEVIVPAGYSAQIVPVVKKLGEAIFVFGDSITQASFGAYSWPRILNRDLRANSDIYNTGAAAMAGSQFISTSTKRNKLIQEFKTVTTGYTKKIFWYDSMVNDVYYNSFTPSDLKALLVAFATELLAAVPDALLYFKSAIPTTAHDNGGPNGLGYPLFAYRDAMRDAVTEVANVRVKYANGLLLSKEQYLTDGTHLNREGTIYMAGTINDLLNSTTSATPGGLTVLNVEQRGSDTVVSTNTTEPVRYRLDGGNWQTASLFASPAQGSHTWEAELINSPFTRVSTTKNTNKVLYFDSPEVTKVGPGWTPASPEFTKSGYTTNDGDYYTFTDAFSGFTIWQSRQDNVPEIVVTIDSQAAVRVPISGPGISYDAFDVYHSPSLPVAQHTVKVESGVSAIMNFYYIELYDAPAPTTPTGENQRIDGESSLLAKTSGTWNLGGMGTIFAVGAASCAFTVPAGVSGFRLVCTKQANTPGVNLSIDGAAPVFVSTYAPGFGNPWQEIHRVTGLSGGSHSVVYANGGTGDAAVSFYYVELFTSFVPAVGAAVYVPPA